MISASTISVCGAAAGLAPKSTAMTCRRRGRRRGGASAFSAPPIHLRRRLGEVEIAIDAVGDALGAERGEALVDLLADGAEFHVGRVAERQHAELDAVEARRALAHQFVVDAHGARRRLALAPGGGDDDQPLDLGERSERRDRPCRRRVGFKPSLRACLATSPASFSRIAGLSLAIHDGQRLGRPRRRRRLRRAA